MMNPWAPQCGVPSEPMYVILPIPRASPYPGRCPGLVCPAPLGRWFVPTGHHIPATPWIPIPGGGREMVNPWAPRCSVPSEPMYVILSIPRAFPYPGRCPGLVCPAPLGRWFVPTGHRIPAKGATLGTMPGKSPRSEGTLHIPEWGTRTRSNPMRRSFRTHVCYPIHTQG